MCVHATHILASIILNQEHVVRIILHHPPAHPAAGRGGAGAARCRRGAGAGIQGRGIVAVVGSILPAAAAGSTLRLLGGAVAAAAGAGRCRRGGGRAGTGGGAGGRAVVAAGGRGRLGVCMCGRGRVGRSVGCSYCIMPYTPTARAPECGGGIEAALTTAIGPATSEPAAASISSGAASGRRRRRPGCCRSCICKGVRGGAAADGAGAAC